MDYDRQRIYTITSVYVFPVCAMDLQWNNQLLTRVTKDLAPSDLPAITQQLTGLFNR